MKKLLFFLMFAIPILAILIVKLTANFTAGEMYITVETIVLDRRDIVASVGDSVDLNYNIYPKFVTNKEVLWVSDNEEAAVVDDKGHVEFIGIGDGYISVITKEGNKRAHCPFHVGDTKVHKVKLSSEQTYVNVGEKLLLDATVLPDEALDKKVSFSTSDETVARVDSNGYVYGLSVGNAIITATSQDGGFSDSLSISVRNPVVGLQARYSEVITSNKSELIEYTIEPFDATDTIIHYTVDDSSIATIDEYMGIITFLQAGEVNVTLTTDDGGYTAEIKYIFTDGYVYNILPDKPSLNLTVGEAPYFEYQLTPENLYNTKVEISSDDENIAYVDQSGYLHAVKGGNTAIRIKAYKNPTEQIEKLVYVNVLSPATDIQLDDAITAFSSYQINPVSLPEDSTNDLYFYHLEDDSLASIDENGLVTFNTDQPCKIKVRVYANQDNGEVYKDIAITYTAGKAYGFELLDKDITIEYNSYVSLNYNLLPSGLAADNLEIIALENDNVLEILPDGRLHALKGGRAKLQVSYTLYDATIVQDYCTVTVIRQAENVQIKTDLEFYEGRYISAEQSVMLSGEVLPSDASDKTIVWSSSDTNIALIRDNQLIFNQVGGSVILTATVGEISNSIEICYVGNKPVYAELMAIIDDQQVELPHNIMVDESFEVAITKTIPSYKTLPQISMQEINSITVNSLGRVLEIKNNKVTGVAGGSATLEINIQGSIRISVPINVEQKPTSISVLQAKSQQTASVINLVSEVLPYDATNKNVEYVVNNPEMATIDGNILTIKSVGVVYLTAIAQADPTVRLDFFIERIEKDTVHLSLQQSSASVYTGELMAFDIANNFSLSIKSQTPVIANEQVVKIEGERYIRALSAGTAVIQVTTDEISYEITITVLQLVESISISNELDYYNDMYVVASPEIELNFNVLPISAANKQVKINIINTTKQDKNEKIALVDGNKITFLKAGIVPLEISSADGNCTIISYINYTGGVALDAELNVGNTLYMNIGDVINLQVNKWIPSDTIYTQFTFKDIINTSGKKVIEVNNSSKTITAVDSGSVKLLVELSSGIVKEINIECACKVSDVILEQNVVTAQTSYTINAQVLPANASNKNLEYILEPTDLAVISQNVITFVKPGTVTVRVRTLDGSNIAKTLTILSTMGYLNNIELSSAELSLNKGESVNLFVNKYPLEASNNTVQFKLINQQAASENVEVVSINGQGKIVALNVGTATIRAYALDFFGNEVYADCTVRVYSPLSSIEVQFNVNLSSYQNKNTFITSRNKIEFNIAFAPQDAQISSYQYKLSNESFARVENNTIEFLQQGRVTITFTAIDEQAIEKSKTYSFYYVGNNIIEASLNKKYFINNTITLQAGENIKFELEKVLPSDNTNLTFSLTDINEKRNDINKPVASFTDGILYALNGGSYSFAIWVNGLKLDNLTLIVTRPAVDIQLEDDENIYISKPTYTIYAHVIESDSDQNELGYISRDTSLATISENGQVTFSQFGECEFEIYIIKNPSIRKIVKITYTKELKEIAFNETLDFMFVGDYIDFTVYAVPQDAIDFSYEVTIDNTNIAKLIQKGDIFTLIAEKCGTVTITARALDKDISVSRTITIEDKITEIKLDLDKTNDINGQGEYRVFANNFYNANNEVINTYQMGVTLLPASSSKELLTWMSSNEEVATVDNNGVVTFVGTGKVTITVRQNSPYASSNLAFDSYTFTIVEGINVETSAQFTLAHAWLTQLNDKRIGNYAYMVLHNNILIDEAVGSVVLNYNIMGNGYILDHSKIMVHDHFQIRRNGIVLDNATFRGATFDGNSAALSDKGIVLLVDSCSDILIYNSIFENAEGGIQFLGSNGTVTGCIFRNCLSSGIKLKRKPTLSSNVTVADCIFTSSFCGVLYVFDDLDSDKEMVLNLEGNVYFYNWSTLDQIKNMFNLEALLKQLSPALSATANEIYSQMYEIASQKGGDYAKEYNGKTYYHFGVVKFDVFIPEKNMISPGRLQTSKLNSVFNYSQFQFEGMVRFGILIPIKADILSLTNDAPYIKPGDRYDSDLEVQSSIKKPCRF